jgi:hypothetical protein
MRAPQPARTVREYVEEASVALAVPAEVPDWDAIGHSVCCAWSEFLRLEAAHADREKFNAQRRHAKALTRRWKLAVGAEDRRLDGRPGG